MYLTFLQMSHQPSSGIIISVMILFLVVVVYIPRHFTMVVIGMVYMFFVVPYNCICIICAFNIEGAG